MWNMNDDEYDEYDGLMAAACLEPGAPKKKGAPPEGDAPAIFAPLSPRERSEARA